jgi:16S rRNA (uracil1498-N3)-methyltransferase
MVRLYLDPERLTGPIANIEGEAYRYLVKVLRLVAGAAVVVFDGQGTEVDARLAAVGPRSARLDLGERRRVPPPRVDITLLQAVPKGDRMDLLVQKTTEIGVARITPVLTRRSVARPPATRQARWQTIAREAARQSGRADLPAIAEAAPLERVLADPGGLPAARFILWEGEKVTPLRRELASGPAAVALLVGPEGGFEAEEVEYAAARGFVPAGLGPRLLRSETAAIVAVALVAAAAGAMD